MADSTHIDSTTRRSAPLAASSDEALWLSYKRGVVRTTRLVWLARTIIVVALIAAWQLAAGRAISTFWISSPSLVIDRLQLWFSTGSIWSDIWVTLEETALGFLLGAGCALILGVIVGLSGMTRRITAPFFTAVYAAPKIALAPLFIVYLGIGLLMKVVLTAVIVFFLVFYNTVDGTRSVDEDLKAVVRMSGAGRLAMLRVILLPSSLGTILTAMKISIPYAFQGAIFAEILASNQGLGYVIQNAAGQFDVTGIFAGIVIVTVVAVIANQLVEVLESHTQRWRLT